LHFIALLLINVTYFTEILRCFTKIFMIVGILELGFQARFRWYASKISHPRSATTSLSVFCMCLITLYIKRVPSFPFPISYFLVYQYTCTLTCEFRTIITRAQKTARLASQINGISGVSNMTSYHQPQICNKVFTTNRSHFAEWRFWSFYWSASVYRIMDWQVLVTMYTP